MKSHKDLVDKEALVSEIQEQDCARKAQIMKLDSIMNTLTSEVQTAKAKDLKLNMIMDTLASEIQKAENARRSVEEEFEKNEKRRISTQRRDIFKWINGIDPEDDKERAGCVQQRQPETGMWLFDRREFQDWVNGCDSSILWVTGIPGCGLYKRLSKYMKTNS